MPLVDLVCTVCARPFKVERWRLREGRHLCSRNCIYRQQTIDEGKRFDDKVEKTATCWTWRGAVSKARGVFRFSGRAGWAQDFAYARAGGELGADYYAVSTCGNSLCVRPEHLTTEKRLTDEERFWSMVDKNGAGGCWNWTGAAKETGYGAFRYRGRTMRPHRLSFEWANGAPPPDDMDLCHRCDNRLCVNPAHLFVGTRTDNMQDAKQKGRLSKRPRSRGPGGRYN